MFYKMSVKPSAKPEKSVLLVTVRPGGRGRLVHALRHILLLRAKLWRTESERQIHRGTKRQVSLRAN